MQEHDAQLELFERLPTSSHKPSRMTIAEQLSLRQDHAVLLMIVGLVGCAAVFACGVERGKRLARSERLLLLVPESAPVAQALRDAEPMTPTPAVEPPPTAAPNASTPFSSSSNGRVQSAAKSQPSKAAMQPKSRPKESEKSLEKKRFAVQVVSYEQPQLAQRELQRLHARGEQAFLIKRQERVVLYVGPFPSKDTAGLKLQLLRQQYRDCFIRVL